MRGPTGEDETAAPRTDPGGPEAADLPDDIATTNEERRLRALVAARVGPILEGLPDRCTLLAHDGTIIYQNRAAREAATLAFGRSVVGERWDATTPKLAGTRLAREIDRALSARQGASFEEHHPALDTWSEFHLHPTEEGLVVYSRDVTSRKRAEAELRSTQAALARSEKLSALGQLVSGVAHELRTPLTFLSTNAFLLKRGLQEALRTGRIDPEVNAAADKHLIEIGQGVDRINQLIEDLRRYTKLRQDGETHASSLDVPIREAVDLFRATDRASHHLEATLRPTRAVKMNPGALQQVILNLLQNAADAMPKGGTIRIRCQDEGDHALVEVEDEGTGIPPEVQKRMFEPLYTTKPSGMGLGLSISRRIADEHGAELTYETAPGAGTTFRLRFPLAKA